MLPLDATTDWINALSSSVAALATVAATVGAWIAVRISLATQKQAEADRAIETQERADRRRDERQDQARRVVMTAVTRTGYTGTRGAYAESRATLKIHNESRDPIFAVDLALHFDPPTGVDLSDVLGATRRLAVATLPPDTPVEFLTPFRLKWPEDSQYPVDVAVLPFLWFTDVHGVRWHRGPDYVLREVLSDAAHAEDALEVQRIIERLE